MNKLISYIFALVGIFLIFGIGTTSCVICGIVCIFAADDFYHDETLLKYENL